MELLEQKWEEILVTVKKEYNISDIAFNTWLKPLKVFTVQNERVYILFSNEEIAEMALTYINSRYYLPLKVVIAEVTGTEYEVEFILQDEAKKNFSSRSGKPATTEKAEQSNLNPYYTFDTFVVGNNNRFAHSASVAVAESPGQTYNPLFIYGGVGLGKTHLMHSIAHHILSEQPDLKVLYVTSETFTNEVIEAIRNSNNTAMKKFREKYRKIDVLLIDDVQFIIGKESTQEEFFHTFNDLHVAKKQIIISSDRPPKEMETLEERIRSRFEWGLLADIGSPDYETRMAILRKKEEQEGFSLNDDILNYIAINIKSNIRELEGALNKLIAYSNLVKTEITMDIAVKELQNLISPDKPREITPQLIIEVVSEHFGITVDQIMSKSRSSNVTKPRQIAMYLCKNMTGHTLDSIGQLLGKRDHSTIINGIKKVTDEMSADTEFKQTVETIRKKINPN
ncbi:MAG: chromosomal replication initiator protein DnaA [Clostridiales bacterium]|nr:chromosomal replication initiator protein DnaA [Clostridiales bacterium]MCD8133999.1 chromosomal replication initiator protein DnaA [Clostridiales bacterium]